ncbi:hypothetical protein P7C71_g54, partial [Lecanoromycetidae sp. Uapishka_2]
MLARAARPKLALAVPALNTTTACLAKSPLPPLSPSPISPTVRNTRMNQRGFSTLQPPTFAYSQTANTKSILKKGESPRSSSGKKLQFNEEPMIKIIAPVPEDYHMSRDERRWGVKN